LMLRRSAASGSLEDALALQIDLESFYSAESEQSRFELVKPFLKYRGIAGPQELHVALYEALVSFPPMALLINLTMRQAMPLRELSEQLFQGIETQLAARAVTALIAVGSLARREPSEPGLLPCRVHSFYRGLPGLWVCMDPDC